MEKKDDNTLYDEIDGEEEIKEEIIINEINKNENFINTYDKFLIDSNTNDLFEKQNEYHYMLKNQMMNILNDIKKKENKIKKIKIILKKNI